MSRERELADKVEKLLKRKYGSATGTTMRLLYTEYDANRDSKINRDELSKLLEDAGVGNGLTRGMWVNGVMDKMDSDSDGLITWEEYERAINDAKSGP
ncbi:MAG: EF-hand domain-containing protein [Sandaracinaceae bacterium]|nr:EF-hand domain-containing protein [Sandaracinaceae bacterium]